MFKHLAFSGIHVFSPSLFAEMEKWNGKFSIIDFYLSAMKANKIIGYEHDDLKLIDVGKIENLKQASDFLKGI
jgi:NDP-sugar pyrophosphorylase family protein